MYAINLKLTGKKAVVVGGGKVALRKVQRLLAEGAVVTVVAPEIVTELAELCQSEQYSHQLSWLARKHQDFVWEAGKYSLVFAATDSEAVNHEVCQQARMAGAWVNDATSPEDCDFFVPSSIQRGKLSLTIGTEGLSPAFTRLLRQDAESRYHAGFGEFLDWLGEMRRELLHSVGDTKERQARWRAAMQPELIELILDNRLEQAKDEVRRKIGCTGPQSSDGTSRDS